MAAAGHGQGPGAQGGCAWRQNRKRRAQGCWPQRRVARICNRPGAPYLQMLTDCVEELQNPCRYTANQFRRRSYRRGEICRANLPAHLFQERALATLASLPSRWGPCLITARVQIVLTGIWIRCNVYRLSANRQALLALKGVRMHAEADAQRLCVLGDTR